MITIEQLQKIEIQQIENPKIQKQVVSILENYKQAQDKQDFISVFQSNMDMVYQFVNQHAPNAIPTLESIPCDCDDEIQEAETQKKAQTTLTDKKSNIKPTEESKPKVSKGKKPKKQKKSIPTRAMKSASEEIKKKVKKATTKIQTQINACRAKIKKYNEQKRKSEPEKRPPSRYEKIKKHFISIGNLRPNKLKESTAVDKVVQRILGKAHRDILEVYQMNSIKKTDRDQKELKEKLQKNKAA